MGIEVVIDRMRSAAAWLAGLGGRNAAGQRP